MFQGTQSGSLLIHTGFDTVPDILRAFAVLDFEISLK